MEERVLLAGFYFTRDEWNALSDDDRTLFLVAGSTSPAANAGAETTTRPPREAASGSQAQL